MQLDAPLDELQPELARTLSKSSSSRTARGSSPPPPIPPIVDVHDLDWERIAASLGPGALRARMRATVEQLEALLDSESGARMLFDDHRDSSVDRVVEAARAFRRATLVHRRHSR